MTDKKCKRHVGWTISILFLAVLSAGWIFVSQDVLGSLGVANQTAIEILTYVPAMGFIVLAGSNREALACEKRFFKKLLGRT